MTVETTGLVVAPNGPQVGDTVRPIGFDLDNVSGAEQLADLTPSDIEGRVSNASRKVGGLRGVELSGGLPAGMAGGPTVNHDHQVVGVISASRTTGPQTSYITNTQELRAFLQWHNVDLVEPPAASRHGSWWLIVGGVALALAVLAGVAAAFFGHPRGGRKL